MGKYLDKFKNAGKSVVGAGAKVVKKVVDNKSVIEKSMDEDFPDEDFDFDDELPPTPSYDPYDDVGIQPAQKPESFHHFILENQFKDLERSIRGFKDVFEKETQKWVTKRKKIHCFTDEEAEEILRTAQSHLATDVKLAYISKEAFPLMMDAIYKELAFLFESIAEYRYGRYNDYDNEGNKIKQKDGTKEVNFELQYQMKLQNHKIFLELFTRVQANYSRAIQGQENKYTHDSVKGQESLQQTESNLDRARGYM